MKKNDKIIVDHYEMCVDILNRNFKTMEAKYYDRNNPIDKEAYYMPEPFITKHKIPIHYDYKIQPVDFIEANGLGFCVGNVIKYICRYDKKGTPLEDLEKAIHYIEILKSNLKK